MRKKILFVITKSVWGGAQRYVFDLATNLPKDQFDAAVACGPDTNTPTETLGQKLRKNNITIFLIPHFQKSVNPLKEIFSFFEILSVCFRFQPDILHANSSKAGGIAGLAALLYQLVSRKKVKRIFTAHGWAFLETWRISWQRVLIRIASKLTTSLYHCVIVLSEYDKTAAFTYNVAATHKVTLIHNGITGISILSHAQAQQELLGKEYHFVIGSVAEWTQNKGLMYLIEAMPSVLEKFPEAKLYLVGWGGEHSKLETCILKLKLEKTIFLTSKSPAAAYLKAFDIFVLPSLKEGLPYTILEAGLAELPVVATRVGGIPDIIENGKNGVLVDSASPAQLANAIIVLAQNKRAREEMGQKLQKHIEQNFSISEMLRKTIEVYTSLEL